MSKSLIDKIEWTNEIFPLKVFILSLPPVTVSQPPDKHEVSSPSLPLRRLQPGPCSASPAQPGWRQNSFTAIY